MLLNERVNHFWITISNCSITFIHRDVWRCETQLFPLFWEFKFKIICWHLALKGFRCAMVTPLSHYSSKGVWPQTKANIYIFVCIGFCNFYSVKMFFREMFFKCAWLYTHKGLEIGSCPIKMVDNFSNQVDFLFNNPTICYVQLFGVIFNLCVIKLRLKHCVTQ